jgi:hypothetical protein
MKHRKVCVKNEALTEFFTHFESIYVHLLPSYQDNDIVGFPSRFAHELLMSLRRNIYATVFRAGKLPSKYFSCTR